MHRVIQHINSLKERVATARTEQPVKAGTGLFQKHLRSELQKSPVFDNAVAPLLKSGAYRAGDNPMKFGIVQTTLKDYDPAGKVAGHVSELDEKKAAEIYRRIWERAGCNNMPDDLAAMHFKAYVAKPKRAMEALSRSKGDSVAYADTIKSMSAKVSMQPPAQKQGSLSAKENKMSEYVQQGSSFSVDPVIWQPSSAGPICSAGESGRYTEGGNRVAETERPGSQVTTMGKTIPESVLPDMGAPSSRPAVNNQDDAGNLQNKQPAVFEQMKFIITTEKTAPAGKTSPEITIAKGYSIAIEQMGHPRQIEAYQGGRSGGILADGFAVKLKIPFL